MIIGDGIADDTAALQAMAQKDGTIRLPAGRYRITAPITVSDRALSIIGDGPGATQIIVANPIGAFAFTLDNKLPAKTVYRIADLDIVLATGGLGGTAISVIGSAHYPYWQGTSQLYIERVRVLSSGNDSTTEHWTNGLYLKNIPYPVIRDFSWMALNTTVGTGINVENDPSSPGFSACFGLLIDRVTMQGGGTGIRATGAIEGIYINPYEMVGQQIPIFIDGKDGPGGQTNVVHVKGGAVASQAAEAIHILNAKNVWLQGIDIYKYAGGSDVVRLEKVSEFNIAGNKIGTGAPGAQPYQLLHLTTAKNGIVSGNNFVGDTPVGGIGIDGSSADVLVAGNHLRSISGPAAQAYYVAFTDKVTLRGNTDAGWATQLGGGANSDFTMADNLRHAS